MALLTKTRVRLIFFVIGKDYIYYHNSCYVKSTINYAGKSDKNHIDKEDKIDT